jgi:hypothetical protein
MAPPTNNIDDDTSICDEPSAVWPVLLAAGSVMLGYVVGRVSYNRDLRAVLRRIEDSSEPIEISIRTV